MRYKRTLCVTMMCIAFGLGFYFLYNSIPSHVNLEAGSELSLNLNYPMNSLVDEQVVTAGSLGESNIPSADIKVSCKFLGLIKIKDIDVNVVERKLVIPGGMPVGVYMKTKGVMVVGTGTITGLDGLDYEPAINIVQSGDYIIGINGTAVNTKEELIEQVNAAGSAQVNLQIRRNEEMIEVSIASVQTGAEEFKLGIWVRDDTQGIGTLTYVDEKGRFGALGHGISDVDTGGLLSLQTGSLYRTDILSIKKGEKGSPGELSGVIRYQTNELLGEITENTNNGIFGTVNSKMRSLIRKDFVEVGYKQEIKEGAASIMCTIDGVIREYDIAVEKVYLNAKEANKSMVIRVIDPDLIAETGGIVQGMSGSPILQNGKIIGAITHVFVQDSTMGYGIFIENML